MKRYLKDYVLTVGKVEDAIYDCLKNKWRRRDVSYFLAEYMMKDDEDIHSVARRCKKIAYYKSTRYLLYETITKAAVAIYTEIENRKIILRSIEYQYRYDIASDKMREIGISSIKQQIYDYLVVNACKKMLMAKIGFYQAASIKHRGQVFGKKAIERWIRNDKKNTKCYYKCDIKKYYPSVNKRILKRMLRRDIKDNDILYVAFFLIDTYKGGLCIGSYLSQFLANYYLSYAYHYITEQSYSVRIKKNRKRIRINHVKHVLFYMDDIIIFSSSMKLLKRAIRDFNWYIANKLELVVKPNSEIGNARTSRIDMMGYYMSIKNTLIRPKIFKKLSRLFLRLKNRSTRFSLHISRRALSFYGWVKHSNLYNFVHKFKINKTIYKCKKEVGYHDKCNFYRETDQLQLLSA